MIVIAHRGASAEAAENSIAAFALAHQLGADMIELDVRASADGVLYVAHDPALAAGAPSWLARRLRWQEIRSLGAATGRYPALAEVLDRFASRIALNLEIKERRAAPLLVAELGARNLAEGVLLSSFDRRTCAWLRSKAPHLPLGLLARRKPLRLAAALRALDARSLHAHHRIVSAGLLRRARALGIPVYVWTVNDPGELGRLDSLGAAGVFSDDPRLALRILRRGQGSTGSPVG